MIKKIWLRVLSFLHKLFKIEPVVDVKLDIQEVAMIPEPHLTMKEAVQKLKELGYEIKTVDNKNRRIIINHGK